MSEYKKICEFCKDDFLAKHKYTKYCSAICRRKTSQFKNKKQADTLECKICATPFKRKCAMDIYCKLCKEKMKFGEKIKVSDRDIPKSTPEDDERMIAAFLAKK